MRPSNKWNHLIDNLIIVLKPTGHVLYNRYGLADQLRIQISKAAKREEKLMQELETIRGQLSDVQRDCQLQKQHKERLEREQKQRETSARYFRVPKIIL